MDVLGVLVLAVLMLFGFAIPARGQEMVAEEAMVIAGSEVTEVDLASLKSALDALEEVLVSIQILIARLPVGTPETIAISESMNATLEGMRVSLIGINGTLAQVTGVPSASAVTQIAKVSPKPPVTNSKGAVAGLSDIEDSKAVEGADKSSLAAILNSPQTAVILLAFALLFGIVFFMRRSPEEEAQLA